MKIIARILVALGTALSPIPSVAAQDLGTMELQVRNNLREIDALEGGLRDAEKARLAGDCRGVQWIAALFLRRLTDSPMSYRTEDGPPANLPPEMKADFERRMRELLKLECPPGSGKTALGQPFEQPQPPVTVVLPPVSSGSGDGDCPSEPVSGGPGPGCPGSVPEGFEPILDEIDEGVGTTGPPPTGGPKPPVPPGPRADRSSLFGARGALRRAEQDCDPVAYQAAKDRLINLLDQLIADEADPGRKEDLERQREEIRRTNMTAPCPPEPRTSLPQPSGDDSDGSRARIEALEDELLDAKMDDLFEKQFGIRPDDSRPTATIEKELEDARADQFIGGFGDEPPPPSLDSQSSLMLDLHNQERATVGVPALRWDTALASSAKAYAVELTSAGALVHSSRVGRKDVRENLLQSLPGGRTPEQMIGVWLAEKRYFTPGNFPDVSSTGNWVDIGHYSQMIWEGTTHVGCATNGDSRFEWLVCHYRPGGNKDGKAVGRPQKVVQ